MRSSGEPGVFFRRGARAGGLAILWVLASVALNAQLLDFTNLTKLSPTINSASEESTPLLSPDGKTLFFTRIFHPENNGGLNGGSDIWFSRWDVTTRDWGRPSNRITVNTRENNTLAGINTKGDVLYLLNTWGIYFARRNGDVWTKPEKIEIPDFRADGFVGIFVSPSYDVILLSLDGKDSHGEEDIYVSLKDDHGNWSSPKNLGPTINTRGFEISPFLSSDKKRLYFASSGHPGFGDADIFYSDRLYESWDIWSAPKNMGEKINSAGFDAWFSLAGDSAAFFASNRDGGNADLYQAKVSLRKESEGAVKKFLTDAELKEFIGAAPMEIRFPRDINALTAAQNELLFFIANKVIPRADLKIQLTMSAESSGEITRQRMEIVSNKLKALGVGSYRVDTGTVKPTADQPIPDGLLKISFFR